MYLGKTSPIEHMICSQVEFKCCKCHKIMKDCQCHENCSCGWIAEKGKPCRNPNTKSCTTKVKYGKYNRKTKRWE